MQQISDRIYKSLRYHIWYSTNTHMQILHKYLFFLKMKFNLPLPIWHHGYIKFIIILLNSSEYTVHFVQYLVNGKHSFPNMVRPYTVSHTAVCSIHGKDDEVKLSSSESGWVCAAVCWVGEGQLPPEGNLRHWGRGPAASPAILIGYVSRASANLPNHTGCWHLSLFFPIRQQHFSNSIIVYKCKPFLLHHDKWLKCWCISLKIIHAK